MRTYICIIVSILFFNCLHCQVLGQDKEGFSTIIQPSASFNLDLTDKVATLNFYQEYFNKNLPNEKKYLSEEMCLIESDSIGEYIAKLKNSWKDQESIYKKHGFVYGIDLKGSSSDGITLLVNNEQVITSSTISGMIGLQWHKRVYNYKKLDTFAKMTYNYRDENPEEIKLIKDIEKEINVLIEQKIISQEKKNELLHFRGTKSTTDKIESIEDKINSIIQRRGFIDLDKVKETLKNRLDTLKIMEEQISTIKTNVTEYQTCANAYQTNRTDSTEKNLNIALNKLKTSIKDFEKNLETKLIQALKLELDYKDFRKSAKWDDVKIIVAYARENTYSDWSQLNDTPNSTKVSLDSIIKAYENYKTFLENKKNSSEDLEFAKGNTYSIQRNLIYFKGGFLGSSFKYDLANDSTSISDRFVNKNFQGYRFELGYTRQFKRYNFIGFNLAMNRTSNAEQLTSTTYKFEKTDTSVTPNITTGSEIKALSGSFDTFFKYGLSFDYVHLVPFHDSNATEDEIKKSKLLLSINPYIRHSFYNKSETLKPNTSLGLGLYSFNKTSGSIAGGIFIQADDIFNVNRNEAINFTKQISFGIVFKLAIKSFDPASK